MQTARLKGFLSPNITERLVQRQILSDRFRTIGDALVRRWDDPTLVRSKIGAQFGNFLIGRVKHSAIPGSNWNI
jgi:hypothetical protein